jgi:hypothetical protein
MKKLSLIAVIAVSGIAVAQQVSSQYTCQALLDGGTFEICGTIPTNYQPTTVTCAVSVPAGSSAGTTINLLGSADGIHYGTLADAGYSTVTVVNGDGGPINVATSFAMSPTNPFQSMEITASATAIDGGAGGPGALNCYIGVLQSQTLHAGKGVVKASRPVDVSATK